MHARVNFGGPSYGPGPHHHHPPPPVHGPGYVHGPAAHGPGYGHGPAAPPHYW